MEVLREIPIRNSIQEANLLNEIKNISSRILETREIIIDPQISNKDKHSWIEKNIKNWNKLNQIMKWLIEGVEIIDDTPQVKPTFTNDINKRASLSNKLKDNDLLNDLGNITNALMQKNNVMNSKLAFDDATVEFLPKTSIAEKRLIEILDYLNE